MLYNLLAPLADTNQLFNLFRYLTFRTGGATMTALLIAFVLGPSLIRWLKRRQRGGQPIREDGPESHLLTKKGTPTMRSEEHTSELQSLMRNSYAVFFLKKKTHK